jgi:uncharacterized protein (DUF1778 family)
MAKSVKRDIIKPCKYSEQEVELITKAAESQGMPFSTFVRNAAIKEAKRLKPK